MWARVHVICRCACRGVCMWFAGAFVGAFVGARTSPALEDDMLVDECGRGLQLLAALAVHVDERASLVLGEEGTYLDIGAQRDWKAPRERLHNPEVGSVFAMVGGVTARQHGRRRWLL